MIRAMHHVSLATNDLERFVGFYRDLLGMKLEHISSIPTGWTPFENVVGMSNVTGRVAQFDLGNMYMEVFCYEEPIPRPGERRPACDVGIRHIAFDVTDVFVEYGRLKAAGVEFISAPKYLDGGLCTSCYFYDPDGNIMEFQEIHPGSPVPPAFGAVAGLRSRGEA
jgi:catechol 2,3-dioxygenase-like lactoylglutathione lyase family enzyme